MTDDRDTLLFEDLVNRHVDLVFHMALIWTRDNSEAEDVVQNAFIRAWAAFDQFERGTNFKAWILKIARNSYIDLVRTGSRRIETGPIDRVSPDEEPAAAVPPPQVIDLDNKEIFYDLFGDEIFRLLKSMPEQFQIAVLLCDVEGLTYAEIADALDLPLGTVRSRVHRGRAILSENLKQYARKIGYLRETRS